MYGKREEIIFKERKHNGGRQRLERGGHVELVFNGYRVLLLQDERVLETDGAYSCTIM